MRNLDGTYREIQHLKSNTALSLHKKMTAVSVAFHRPSVMPGRRFSKSGFPPLALGKTRSDEIGEGRKALIVDDNLDLLDMAAHQFMILGFEVLTASNGEIALELLQRQPDISVLFSDVVMPGINGVQLGHAAVALIPNLKVILVSGYPAIPAGITGTVYDFDFLNKPYQLKEITRLLADKE